jgi:hypothetical protein
MRFFLASNFQKEFVIWDDRNTAPMQFSNPQSGYPPWRVIHNPQFTYTPLFPLIQPS